MSLTARRWSGPYFFVTSIAVTLLILGFTRQPVLRTQSPEDPIPVGSVLAFAGDTSEIGDWLPCDGRPLRSDQFPALKAAIGTRYGDGRMAGGGSRLGDFNLPDYRGEFLRGVDRQRGADPDAATRHSSSPATGASASGDAVGSAEDFRTARPQATFTTDSAGAHNHFLPIAYPSDPVGPFGPARAYQLQDAGASGKFLTSVSGAHAHQITSGGDIETRPRNIAVLFLCKVK